MALVQTVESKFSVQYILVSALVLNNCLLDLVYSKPLEETSLTECTCDEDFLMCSNLGLTEIPTKILSENVLSFDFSQNKLTCLRDFVFRNFSNLEYLKLSENEIEEVLSGAFQGLARLNYVDLSYNKLRNFIPAIFLDNPVLQRVSFRGNQLAYFPDSRPILASISITTLDLSHCYLTSINADTFVLLPRLKVLNLNSNRLLEISWDYLNTLTDLTNVDLGNNKWKCDCKIVEVLKILSNRRKSINVEGEYKPIECFEERGNKTMLLAEIKKFCTGQTEKEGNISLEPKLKERACQEISKVFGPKDIEIKMDKPECKCVLYFDMYIYSALSFVLCFYVFFLIIRLYRNAKMPRKENKSNKENTPLRKSENEEETKV